jgi:polyferredoxin
VSAVRPAAARTLVIDRRPPELPEAGTGRLAQIGEWLRRHQSAIRSLQWGMIGLYLVLLVPPALAPLPEPAAGILDHLTVFTRFVFWGVWWPSVLVATVLFGRVWCGLFCPEGALTEFASSRGRGRAIPRWILWGGWPFVAFLATTIYGQMISVYQYPRPTLLILGGSTFAAILVGASYGRGKRVWCRYLCPVSGVFGVLAKLSPLHFAVDGDAWSRSQALPKQRFAPVNCAPLVPLRTMRGASSCHMCGRCSGFRGAIRLAARSPNREIVEVAGDTPARWETLLLLYGLIGAAAGAFHWASSPRFVELKLAAAAQLIEAGIAWPLTVRAPWWILTSYPEQNDVLTLLDGVLLVVYVTATALAVGTAVALFVGLGSRCLGPWCWARFHQMVQALIPVAAAGVFLGLSALTVTMLRAEGYVLAWVPAARVILLAAAALWSLRLATAIAARYSPSVLRRGLGSATMAMAVGAANVSWVLLFWVW